MKTGARVFLRRAGVRSGANILQARTKSRTLTQVDGMAQSVNLGYPYRRVEDVLELSFAAVVNEDDSFKKLRL